jgi:hypothetical protein
MQPSLQTASHLYLIKRKAYERVLAPGIVGVSIPVAADGLVVRAAYISAGDDVDTKIPSGASGLEQDRCHLLFLFSSPDGPPLRSARSFVYVGEERISWQENSHSHHNQPAWHFRAPGLHDGYVWENDMRTGMSGWFLTGSGGLTALWKVARYEIDAFGHWFFTLAPVQSVSGLPRLDLSRITDGLLRDELLKQYDELQGSVSRHAYRDAVTKARNITEGVLGWALIQAGEKPGKDLFGRLEKLKKSAEQRSAPISDLSYHLAHKIRLLHARTHPEVASSQGRAVSPDLALTCLEDLKEILGDLQMIALPKGVKSS